MHCQLTSHSLEETSALAWALAQRLQQASGMIGEDSEPCGEDGEPSAQQTHTRDEQANFFLAALKKIPLQLTMTTPRLLLFFGEMGSGKTTFVKELALAAGAIRERDELSSPTYTYLSIHSFITTLCHFDLYRLPNAEEFLLMGFDEYFSSSFCCIEWAERIEAIVPSYAIRITCSLQDELPLHGGESFRKFDLFFPEELLKKNL